MKKVLITFFLLTFFLSFSNTNAQVQTPIDGITITSYPADYEPGETVTISIESYLFDLNSTSVVWLSNGVNIGQGIGMKEIKVKAPQAGKKLVVTAVTKSADGKETNKSVTLKSGSVDIVWEPISYTPPFYKGKNLFVFQNRIKLIAMPHLYSSDSKELDAKNLVYQWKMGGKYIDSSAGYGSQTLTINSGSIPKPLDISVEVYNKEQTADATANITIDPTEPSVEFYETDPLYGTYFNKVLSNAVSLKNSEITIFASPFGFNSLNNPLTYTWMVNYIEQPNLVNNQSITLRSRGDSSGASNINLDIKNVRDILQGVNSSFNINFTKKDTADNNVSTF